MPYTAPPSPMTTSFWNANVKDQTVATVLAAGKPTGTEGQVIAVTDSDRLEIYNGSVWLPSEPWSSSGRVGVSLTDATNRSIPTGTSTYTAITWGTEVYDSDGFITAASDTITVPTNRGGLYAIAAQTTWASSPGANSVIEISVNGTVGWRQPIGAATQSLLCMVSATIALAAGDTVKIRLSQGSGGAINVNPSSMQMWRISA